MWRTSAIPTCGFRVWEAYSSPVIPQRCVSTSCLIQVEHSFCQLCHVGIRSCFPPDCVRGQCSERQPNGEHHEATEGTSPVPLGSAQAICFFRYVALLMTTHEILRKRRDGKFLTEGVCAHVLRAQHHPSHQWVSAPVSCQGHVPFSSLDHYCLRGVQGIQIWTHTHIFIHLF